MSGFSFLPSHFFKQVDEMIDEAIDNCDCGGGSSTNLSIKEMQAGAAIGIGKPVSKRADGKIVESDSDNLLGPTVGISQVSFGSDGIKGNVLLIGSNAAGVLSGMGFAPGDIIYLSKTTGAYTNNTSSYDPETDNIVQIGIADCAAGNASGTATDLIMFPYIVSNT